MLRNESVTFSGAHYTVKDTINHPAPLSKIPVMIGGSGEKKTLRMVAQYADESNLTCPLDEVPRKLEALAAHCERLGRDRSEITVSKHVNVGVADTHEQAYAELARFLGDRGLDLSTMDDETKELILAMVIWGDESEVGEQLTEVLALGVDGLTMSLPGNGYLPERVEQLGAVASKVLA
jgi:alkanesulfonate monooxygenase SsuD/methylene tetrahydromethanopterin reductase-like flavin-dependent oxidoreductase (luciferase family)